MPKKESSSFIGIVMLLITAFIWGSAFVAQSVGNAIGSFTFNASRSLIGGIFLLPVIAVIGGVKKRRGTPEVSSPARRRRTLLAGCLCGILLCISSNLQQIGIGYTTVGKAGFITALYILEVPLIGLFFKRRVRPILWGCIALALVGLYLLCMQESFSLSLGDALVLACSLAFSFHILAIDHFAAGLNGVWVSCIQFFVSGTLSLIAALIFESPDPAAIVGAWFPICYAGVLSSGVAYTLQIVAQQRVTPVIASLLMSLESVFAVLTAAAVLGQIPSLREAIGCGLMFVAILLAQLPDRKKTV